MATNKEIKKKVVSSIVDAVLPDILAGVGKGVADLRYEKDEDDQRGFLKRAWDKAKGNVKDTFSARNLAGAMLPTPLALGAITAMDIYGNRKKKIDDPTSVKTPKPPQNTSMGINGVPTQTGVQAGQLNDEDDSDVLEDILDAQLQSIEILKKIDDNTTVDKLKAREEEIEANKQKQMAKLQSAVAGTKAKQGAGAIASMLKETILGALGGWLGLKSLKSLGGKAIGAAGGLLARGGSLLGKGAVGAVKAVPALMGAKAALDAKAAPVATGAVQKAVKPASTLSKLVTGGRSIISNSVTGVTSAAGAAKGYLTGILGNGGSSAEAIAKAAPSTATQGLSAVEGAAKGAQTAANSAATVAKSASTPGILDSAKKGLAGFASTAQSAGSKVVDVAKSVGSKGLKLLGTPMMVATSLLEANDVANDDKMGNAEKNTAYTKIGAKLAGMWLGAKAGASVGAMGGGAIGTAFAGVGAAPGAAIGGVLGGIAGAFGGAEIGENLGEKLGLSLFSDKTVKSPDDVTLKSEINNKDISVENMAKAVQYDSNVPKSVKDYVTGNSEQKYESIKKDYYNFLDSKNITYDDKSAVQGIALAKQNEMKYQANVKALSKYADDYKVKNNLFDTNNLVKPNISSPDISNISVGETRNTALNNLSTEMQQDHIQTTTPSAPQAPVIIQAPSAPAQSSPGINNGGNREGFLGVPSIRNNEGTIQRLLEQNYRPLLG